MTLFNPSEVTRNDYSPIAPKALRIPSVLLPTTSVDSSDAVVHTVDAELIRAHADNVTMLEMRSVCDSIVAFAVALVCDPKVAEDGN